MTRTTDTSTTKEEAVHDRRDFLTKAAVAAAVSAVAGVAVSHEAQAANGGNMLIGANNTGTLTTQLGGGSTLMVVSGSTNNSASIVGYQSASNRVGVYGETSGTSGGYAVYGRNYGSQGRGVYGRNDGSGGVGVYGQHVAASTEAGTGVIGVSNAGAGVVGNGTTADLQAGGSGRILLNSAGAASPPATGTVGTIARDAGGSMWVCVATNQWRRIAGPTVAGALVAITPTRVYDSRQALPTPGVIQSGQTRNVSVKDGRATGGGAVTVPDLVPAGATAVMANVTVASTTGAGYLAINPGGVTTVSASTINWFGSGQTLANGVLLTINPSTREVTVYCGDGAGVSTHFIIDVTGYYR